jgi:hypothetical protein
MVMIRDKLMRNPQEEFRSPERLLEDQELSAEQKISLLMNWRSDLLEMQCADSENMQSASEQASGVATELKSVTDALTKLGADPATGGRHHSAH